MSWRIAVACLAVASACAESAAEEVPSELAPAAAAPLTTLERLEAAVEETPEDREAWSALAVERLEAEDAEGAGEAAARALALSGDAPRVEDAETLASAHTAGERWAEARDALAQVVELAPERPGAQLALARAEEHLGHRDAAESAYRAAIAADTDDIEARMRLAASLIGRCREENGGACEELLEEAGTSLEAARTHLDENDPRESALAAYEEDLAELERSREERSARAAEAVAQAQALIGQLLGGDPLRSSSTGLLDLGEASAVGDVMAQSEGVGVATASEGSWGRGGLGTGGLGARGGGGRLGSASGLTSLRGNRQAAPSVRVRVTGGASGALQGAVVTRVARRHETALRRCHAAAAQQQPALAGNVAVHFRISEAGVVQNPSASGSAANPGLRTCVESVVQRMAFPTAEGPSQASVTATFSRPRSE